jgi:AraC family transcriptional regulator
MELDSFVVSETHHARTLILPSHSHECASLNVTLDGCYCERVEGLTRRAGPGTLLLKPPGVSHENTFADAEARSLLIELRPERFAVVRRHTDLFDAIGSFSARGLLHIVRRIVFEIRQPDLDAPLAVEGLVMQILTKLSRRHRHHVTRERTTPGWLLRTRDEAEASATRGGCTLSVLADHAGVHATHLARAFKERFGVTVTEFVRERRVAAATATLVTTSRSVGSIAADAGFADQSHFARLFRRMHGRSPREYRRERVR